MSNIIEGITKDLKAIPKNLKVKAGGMDTKKLVLLNLPYIFVGYFCDKVAWLWCKLRSNGMPVPLLRNGYSIFNGTKYR